MPTEIADSDGESELSSPAKVGQVLANCPADSQQSAASNSLGVNFSDFLSQDQQLSKEWRLGSPNRPPTSPISIEVQEMYTGRGEERAREQQLTQDASATMPGRVVPRGLPAFETTPTTSRKRRHATWNDGDGANGSDHLSHKRPRMSMAKTYGNSSGHHKSSQPQASDDDVQNITHAWQSGGNAGDSPGQASFASVLAESQVIARINCSMLPPTTASTRTMEECASPRRRNRPRRVLSLLGESGSEAPREISTSRSSIGNYESINIDFRSSASGCEGMPNPFDSLLQTPAEHGDYGADAEKMEVPFRLDGLNKSPPMDGSTQNPSEVGSVPERWPGCSGTHGDGQHQTLGRSNSIDPILIHHNLPNGTQPVSFSTTSTLTSGNTILETSLLPPSQTDVPAINRSTSDKELVSTKLSARTPGGKPKSQCLERASLGGPIEEEGEGEADRHVALAIGRPQEQYPPHPGHSPAVVVDMALFLALPDPATTKHEVQENQQSSPVKQPTSELNLSDEAFIGLPKENYRPRPSRSRSKRTTAGDEKTAQPETIEAVGEAPICAAVLGAANTTPMTKSKKPAKKTKVKRAKTSAAALLKKSQAMLSEGEEDVLWLETKPREVKLDLPPAIKREVDHERNEIQAAQSNASQVEAGPKDEAIEGQSQEANLQDKATKPASPTVGAPSALTVVDHLRHEPSDRTDSKHITVNIPPQRSSAANVGPKKKGQKKKSPEIVNDEDVDLQVPGEGFNVVAEANVSELPEKADAAAEESPSKKRGRKKEVGKHSPETEDAHGKPESESDDSPSETTRTNTQLPLAEKDPNHPASLSDIQNSEQSPLYLIDVPRAAGKENNDDSAVACCETPHKQASSEGERAKGPTKHSPINPSGGKTVYRVGLSKRATIPRLLKIVRKDVGKPSEKEKPKRKLESYAPVEDED